MYKTVYDTVDAIKDMHIPCYTSTLAHTLLHIYTRNMTTGSPDATCFRFQVHR